MSAHQPRSSFVTEVDLKIAPKLKKDLEERGFEFSQPAYTIFSAKAKGISCTLYQSGKLMVQGKEMQEFIEFYLEPEILQSVAFTHAASFLEKTGRIGIDESGKGDFFGPLCIAGVYAEGKDIEELHKLGVKDSKKINDAGIIALGRKIKAQFTHHIVKINPQKYNELYDQFRNLNRLLAWGHATTIEQLVVKTDCRSVIIDQFASEDVVITALRRKKLEVTLTQRHRAEEDLVVAAASILARQAFLEGLAQLSEQYGIKLPKGASAATITAANHFVREHGWAALPGVAKMHFKTIDSIKS